MRTTARALKRSQAHGKQSRGRGGTLSLDTAGWHMPAGLFQSTGDGVSLSFTTELVGGFTIWLEPLDVLGLICKCSNWLRAMEEREKKMFFDLVFISQALKLQRTFVRGV